MTNSRKDFRVDIEKRTDSTVIRIRDVDEVSFDDAFAHVHSLFNRALNLEKKFQAEKMTSTLWYETESGYKLSDIVTQSSHRVALVLFRAYPNSKTTKEVVKEAGIPQSSVSVQLTGRKVSVSNFFEKTQDGYRLTTEGFEWVLNEVMPFVSIQSGKEKK